MMGDFIVAVLMGVAFLMLISVVQYAAWRRAEEWAETLKAWWVIRDQVAGGEPDRKGH